MALFLSSLNSGSNANCYYVGTRQYGVLIDAGLSLKQTRLRLKQNGIAESAIKALFISHEHADHIKGLAELANAMDLPVYASTNTWRHIACAAKVPSENLRYFKCGDEVMIHDMKIDCFAKRHDGVEPHSFVVERAGTRVGIFTDIGEPCEKLRNRFRTCHAAVLEANYDEEMLANGRYPFFLKKRISGALGHLSNQQALELFLKCRSRQLRFLMLGHLSKENNRPQLVEDLFASHKRNTSIFVASRYEASPLFCIGQHSQATHVHELQLSLF